MGEAGKFPSGIEQYANFVHGLKLMHHAAPVEINSRPVSTALYGLLTLIPSEVIESGILQDGTRRTVANVFVNYLISYNDSLDWSLSGLDNSDVSKDIEASLVTAEQRLHSALDLLHDPETATNIETTLQEIHVIEDWARAVPLTIDNAMLYRNLTNAICNCAVMRVMFGNNRIPLTEVSSIDVESIKNKYQWVFGETYEDSFQRAIMIMHNLGMAAQVDDDWFGREIDAALGIPSIAQALINDDNVADPHHEIKSLRENYACKAERLGLEKIPTKTLITIHRSMIQRPLRIITRYFGKRVGKRVLRGRGVREQAYIDGHLTE